MYLRKGIRYPLKRRARLDRGVDGLSELWHRKPGGQGQGRSEEARSFLAESREIFGRLKATPWLERLVRSESGVEAPAPV